MATGNLSLPRVPALPGLSTFKGNWYHSGLWPKESVDFARRRVGVIGTGSSGIQMIPIIAEQAAHLHVFQRTANFSVPAVNRPTHAARLIVVIRSDMRTGATRRSKHHSEFPAIHLPRGPPSKSHMRNVSVTTKVSGRPAAISASYTPTTTCWSARSQMRPHLNSYATRSATSCAILAELLQPRDHPIGTKRLCLDTGYFETFNRQNVTLVDIKSDPIVAVTPDGLAHRDARV